MSTINHPPHQFTRFMDTNNLFTIEPVKCTASPTSLPSESPTISAEPTAFPTMAPTLCSDSYLDSDNLNINLAIDLSFSTYEKTFSAEVDIGDVNGDGKGNTILDAQVVAIEELLKSIQDSPSLNNANCEIHIISFETDAIDHGTWRPLSADGSQINTKLMDYIKKKLRAPISSGEVYDTNNGYTNFDAALDLSVAYFEKKATPDRLNLLVFLSDGEPNVRGVSTMRPCYQALKRKWGFVVLNPRGNDWLSILRSTRSLANNYLCIIYSCLVLIN